MEDTTRLLRNASRIPAWRASAAYQRVDQPEGGKTMKLSALKEISTTKTSGASRKQ